jgi:hypothetical protein
MKQLKKGRRPIVLTVNGKGAAIAQDADAYQRLLDIAAQPDAARGFARVWRTLGRAGSGRRESCSKNSERRMAYLVNVAARAERDLALLFREINAEHSNAVVKWRQAINESILSLGGESEPLSGDTGELQPQTSALWPQASHLSCDLPRCGEAQASGGASDPLRARQKFKRSVRFPG